MNHPIFTVVISLVIQITMENISLVSNLGFKCNQTDGLKILSQVGRWGEGIFEMKNRTAFRYNSCVIFVEQPVKEITVLQNRLIHLSHSSEDELHFEIRGGWGKCSEKNVWETRSPRTAKKNTRRLF